MYYKRWAYYKHFFVPEGWKICYDAVTMLDVQQYTNMYE